MNAILDRLRNRPLVIVSDTPAQTRIMPTHEELVLRVDRLAHELNLAHQRIVALESHANGKTPTLDDADSARKLMAHIGRAMGNQGDTAHLPVRNHLLRHANFADLRTALAPRGLGITSDIATLRWLAQPSKMDAGSTRFELIFRGAFSARALAVAER